MGTRNFTLVLAAAVAGMGSISFGQSSTQSTRPAEGPQVSSPYWNPLGGDMNRDQGSQFGERLMEKTVLAVPQAAADAVVAKWQFRRANDHLNFNADGMRRDFTESDEYAAALDEFKKAYRDLDNARMDALKGMRSSADYSAIESFRKQVSDQIADERDQDDPSLERLVALAQLKLQSVAPVRVAEQDAIENSSAVRTARTHLIDAAKKVAKIEREFAHDVRDSIDLADARKAKEDARIAMLASATYLDEMRIARNIAVGYSYVSGGGAAYAGGTSPYGYGFYGGGGYGFGGVNYGGFGTGVGPIGGFGGSGFGAGGNAFIGPGAGRNGGVGVGGNRPGNDYFNPFAGSRTSYNPFGTSSGFFHPGSNGGVNNTGNTTGGGDGPHGGNAITGPTGGR